MLNKKMFVAESASIAGIVERVPATGCASGDIMWLLDEPNQPYEGDSITHWLYFLQ